MPKHSTPTPPAPDFEDQLAPGIDPFVQNAPTDNGSIEIDTTGWTLDRSIPEGDYRAVLLQVERSTSQAGNPMLVWDFALIEGQYAGKEFRTWTVLTESQAWKLQEVLRATGLGAIGGKLSLNYSECVNRLVILRLVTGKDNEGNNRSEIKRVFPPIEGAGFRWQGGVPDFAEDPGPTIAPAPGGNGSEEF